MKAKSDEKQWKTRKCFLYNEVNKMEDSQDRETKNRE